MHQTKRVLFLFTLFLPFSFAYVDPFGVYPAPLYTINGLLCAIYLGFVLVFLNQLYYIKYVSKSFRLNVANFIVLQFVAWAVSRIVFTAVPPSKASFDDQLDLAVFVGWLDIFAGDLVLSAYSGLIVTWYGSFEFGLIVKDGDFTPGHRAYENILVLVHKNVTCLYRV